MVPWLRCVTCVLSARLVLPATEHRQDEDTSASKGCIRSCADARWPRTSTMYQVRRFGDLILSVDACGGSSRPATPASAGDEVTIETEGLASVTNPVVAG